MQLASFLLGRAHQPGRPGGAVRQTYFRASLGMANVCWGGLLGIDSAEGDGLAPNDDPTTWVQRIASEPADLMLVGHLPHLGWLASVL